MEHCPGEKIAPSISPFFRETFHRVGQETQESLRLREPGPSRKISHSFAAVRWNNPERDAITLGVKMGQAFRAVRDWVDRDWEKRSYIPTYAIAQRLLFLLPLALLAIIDLIFELQPGSPTYYWSFGIAGAMCLLIGAFQGWRWVKGYSRPSWHEEQARKHAEQRDRSR